MTSLAVIIPAYNAEATLEACLRGLAASTRRPDEIILFNDGATDGTVAIAERHGVRVITGEKRAQGPAVGRNIAAHNTDADLLIFVDADVEVHPASIGILETALKSGPDVAAAFGSYDDAPQSRRIAALYANLRHHHYHQHSKREASTFWSGFGAIWRKDFLEAGGFDHAYSRPSIEDIDLGVRLRKANKKILLAPEALAKHCKDWGLIQLWRTDIFSRAIPWSRLIAGQETDGADLNTSARERIVAVIAHSIWLFAIASLFAPAALVALAAAVAAFVLANWKFFRLLARSGGPALAIAGVFLHWLYYLYSSVIFVLVRLSHQKGRPYGV
jgi:glycosyltransferase involved in cell wall biosynthesis